MAPTILPPQEYLRECLDYHPETGELFWRERPLTHFPSPREYKIWKSKYAGKKAGTQDEHGYIYITVSYRRRAAHRLIWKWMTGKDPAQEIDHRDLIPNNNRWTNLREATRAQQRANGRAGRNNALGLKGVTYHAPSKLFRATITSQGKFISLGYFHTKEEAKQTYDAAARQLWGEFAHS